MVREEIQWFVEGANSPQMSGRKGKLAEAMGIGRGAVSDILAGRRDLSFIEALAAKAFFDANREQKELEGDLAQTVRLVGYVGAGAEAVLFGDGDDPNEWVAAPEGSTADTVAVEIRGTSLGELFDRWLVFYDQRREEPTSSMIGRLCVVGLADGRILVKQLRRGQLAPPHYNLFSNTEPPIYDAIVSWAALVKQMTPR